MDKEAAHVKKQKITSKKVILTSFLVDVLDVILNLILALISGSVVMLTEVLEGFSDLVSSAFLMIGFYRSMQGEDKTHPFGYGTEIYFWSLLSALVMFGLTSTLAFYFGWNRFFNPQPIHSSGLALTVLIITTFTNLYAFLLSFLRLVKKKAPTAYIQDFFPVLIGGNKNYFYTGSYGYRISHLGQHIARSIFFYG
ncbi:cation transporter [Patescibacteria group bacterium]|nr:cation transporter [Patescibacteria group bacterium]